MMIKKVNFFNGKESLAGLYENKFCEACNNPLDLRLSNEYSITCSSCGKINKLKTITEENNNEK